MNIGWTQWGVGGPGKGQHTHSVHRDTQGGWNLGLGSDAILTHVSVALPLTKLMGSELWEAHWGGECRHGQTHTHTQCPRDTQGRWSLVHGSDAILTHVSVAAPLIKLTSNDHLLSTVGSGGTRQGPTHTQCPP